MDKKILIICDAKHKTIDKMAVVVASGVRAGGAEAVIESCEAASAGDFENYDGIIIGSPSYFAGPSACIKGLIDSTYHLKGKLEGKVGAAFTTSEHIGGGNELTLRAITDSFFVHGMIVQGDPKSDHFGAVVVTGSSDIMIDTSGECYRLGRRVAELVLKLS